MTPFDLLPNRESSADEYDFHLGTRLPVSELATDVVIGSYFKFDGDPNLFMYADIGIIALAENRSKTLTYVRYMYRTGNTFPEAIDTVSTATGMIQNNPSHHSGRVLEGYFCAPTLGPDEASETISGINPRRIQT